MVINQKSRINGKVSEYKSQFNNVLFRLEKEKDNEIKEIEDFCENNTKVFEGLYSVSYGIRQILSGNVNEVCNHMTYSEIDMQLSNLEAAVKKDEINELRDYYSSGQDEVETFDKYIEKRGLDVKYDTHPNGYVDNRNQICSKLSELKDMYRSLYDIQKEIDEIKETIEKNTEELKQILQMNLYNSINL